VEGLVAQARRLGGLTQDELARRSGTSRPTLSAYEHGRKSPTLVTAERIVSAAGFALELVAAIDFRDVVTSRGRVVQVPDRLWRLPVQEALARVTLPLHLNWSVPGREFDLRDRTQRARVYEVLLREGSADDLLSFVDGALLVDAWSDLVLPQEVRRAWEPVVNAVLHSQRDPAHPRDAA
jgi:transcriptional regulator with XRE-family HTH domain